MLGIYLDSVTICILGESEDMKEPQYGCYLDFCPISNIQILPSAIAAFHDVPVSKEAIFLLFIKKHFAYYIFVRQCLTKPMG